MGNTQRMENFVDWTQKKKFEIKKKSFLFIVLLSLQNYYHEQCSPNEEKELKKKERQKTKFDRDQGLGE